jgi:hypothetical protein
VKLSIVIAARSGSAPSLRCLESLRAAPQWSAIEVILVNCLGSGAAIELDRAGAEVVVVPAAPQWRITRQREVGVRRASGDIIAVLHERYHAPPGWVDAVLLAHAGDDDVAGGTVAPGSGLNAAGWAMYLSEYWHACPPARSGPLDAAEAIRLPGGNISYKRPVLALGNMASARGESDFHASLFAAGARFRRETRMQANFATPPTVWEYMVERVVVSRDFAAGRSIRMGMARRCAAALARCALPGLIVVRVARCVIARSHFRRRFLAALPWIVLFASVQMAGEMWGYLRPSRSEPSE